MISRSGTMCLRLGLLLASMAPMKLAMEHVRRMRGGAQAHLMRCDDGGYYIVKFQNNPQHLRVLANEMLATRLAARLGLCVPQVEVVEVRPELIAYTSDLVIQLGVGRMPCSAGKQFGSQFPGHPAHLTVHDFLPDEQLGAVGIFWAFLSLINGRATRMGARLFFFVNLKTRPAMPGIGLATGLQVRPRRRMRPPLRLVMPSLT
jgi:hypothetical protein